MNRGKSCRKIAKTGNLKKKKKTQTQSDHKSVKSDKKKYIFQGGWIIYFGESCSVSMDMVNDFWKIVLHFYGLKKL